MTNYPGYVYVLYNQAVQGYVKIGKTTKDPEERAKELSSATGVLAPFVVVYKAYFADCTTAEAFIHTCLKDKRQSENKEFFRISVSDAIQVVIQAERFFATPVDSQEVENYIQPLSNREEFANNIMAEAYKYYEGEDDYLEDREEALKLFKQAAKLGSAKASRNVGILYITDDSYTQKVIKHDIKQALGYFKDAIDRGDAVSWMCMAICYFEMREFSNAEKCWVKFFTSESLVGKENELSMLLWNFYKFMYHTDWMTHHPGLQKYYDDVVEANKGSQDNNLGWAIERASVYLNSFSGL